VRKRNPCFALPYNIRTKAIHCQFAKTGRDKHIKNILIQI
jgi:hypothetical protein